MPEAAGGVTIFIADYYNAFVRAVGPGGTIRNVSEEARVVLGAPSRFAYEPRRDWLWVADSSNDQIVALDISKISNRPLEVPRPVLPAAARKAR